MKFPFPDLDEHAAPRQKLPDCPECGRDELGVIHHDFMMCYACGWERWREDTPKLLISGSAEAEIARLRAAIREHRNQRADDRCILDDNRLYAAAGLEPADHRVGDKFEMLKNCARFIEHRCESGGPWKTYAELEAAIAELVETLRQIRDAIPETRPGRLHVVMRMADVLIERHGAHRSP